MKFFVLHVFIFCICLGQIYSETDPESIEKKRNKDKKQFFESFEGISEQFVDDLLLVNENSRNDRIINNFFQGPWILINIEMSEQARIDVQQVKNFHSRYGTKQNATVVEIAAFVDQLTVFQSALSAQLPPERYNGIVNMYYIFAYSNATTEEIESVLNYMYGNDTAAKETSFLSKFADLTAADCPEESRKYLEVLDKLKLKKGIRSKIFQDFTTIHEKFPCDFNSFQLVRLFVNLIDKWQGDDPKINICKVKKDSETWKPSNIEMKSFLKGAESDLSTRLTNETFGEIIKFERLPIFDTPIDEIEKTLEYVYDDVPKTECPVTVSSTSKTD